MKLYKIILTDKREQSVPADSYSVVDGEYVFYADGRPIPDVFFKEDWVVGITVECENYDDGKPARYRLR